VAKNRFDLAGRIALVTGAYRGLGYAIAQGLAEAGATVVLNGRKAEPLASAVKTLNGTGCAPSDRCSTSPTKKRSAKASPRSSASTVDSTSW